MKVRRATRADLPALRDIIFDAMSLDPEWMGLFPRGAAGDAEYVRFVEATLTPALDASSRDSFVTVVEMEGDGPRCPGLIAAAAVWDMARVGSEQGFVAGRNEKGRFAGVVDEFAKGQQKYFAGVGRYMHLRIMATRPCYQQQGCAKALCQWGVDTATKGEMGLTVLTGPRGYILFSDLGFVDLGPFHVHVGGAREEIVVKAMVLAPKRKARRGSVLGAIFEHVSW